MATTKRVTVTTPKRKKPPVSKPVKAKKKVVAKAVSKKANTPLADLMNFDANRRKTLSGRR